MFPIASSRTAPVQITPLTAAMELVLTIKNLTGFIQTILALTIAVMILLVSSRIAPDLIIRLIAVMAYALTIKNLTGSIRTIHALTVAVTTLRAG
jgi:hypothetical protein